jgi:hypothetical protein
MPKRLREAEGGGLPFRDEKRAEPLVKGREFDQRTVSLYERMPEVKREYTENEPLESPSFMALRRYVLDRRRVQVGEGKDFEEYEKELHKLISSCEAELLAEDLARHDVDAPYIVVDGERFRRAIRAGQTYVGQAGEKERGRLERHGSWRTWSRTFLRRTRPGSSGSSGA